MSHPKERATSAKTSALDTGNNSVFATSSVIARIACLFEDSIMAVTFQVDFVFTHPV